jgi:LysE type translocator
MPNSAHFLVFLTAAFLLAIAPGPGKLYVLARTLARGKREGRSRRNFRGTGEIRHGFYHGKYAGAAYLCYLGMGMMIEARRNDAGRDNDQANDLALKAGFSAQHPLWQGVTTEALNPKTALFFLSFIPQFVLCRKRLLAISVPGQHLRSSEHFGGSGRNAARRASGEPDSLIPYFPPPPADFDRCDDDRLGNVFCDQ